MNVTSAATSAASSIWGTAADTDTAAKPAAATDVASKDTFLQLLVAQLKAQNPLDPQDGAEFVAQLATFTQLEKTISMSQDLEAIRKQLETAAAPSTVTTE